MMRIRRETGNLHSSFQSTRSIPATLAALREYMQSQCPDRPFTENELGLIKFRHRTKPQQEGDVRLKVEGLKQWAAAWIVLYTTEEHYQEARRVAKLTGGKPTYRQTVFGYCDIYPIG
jgi:hypothetical protein